MREGSGYHIWTIYASIIACERWRAHSYTLVKKYFNGVHHMGRGIPSGIDKRDSVRGAVRLLGAEWHGAHRDRGRGMSIYSHGMNNYALDGTGIH